MTAVQPFDFAGQQVRVITIDGEPWFVASDVARVLGYRMASDMTRRLDPEDRGTRSMRTPSGDQEMTIVSEAGMYEAVLGSQIPTARDFKRWVTRDVLPEIRKTGTYTTTPATALTEDEIVHQALQIQSRKIEALTARVAELEPKADLADNYLTAKPNGRLLREVAKAFGMRERDLRAFLIEERMVFTRQSLCGSVVYDFRVEFRPHFESRETVVNHSWGTCQHYTLYLTPRGVGLVRKRIADRRAAVIGAQS